MQLSVKGKRIRCAWYNGCNARRVGVREPAATPATRWQTDESPKTKELTGACDLQRPLMLAATARRDAPPSGLPRRIRSAITARLAA